jgi:GNAT superfamily N-acetyltransferase
MSVGAVILRSPTPDDVESAAHCHLDCWREAYTGLVPDDRLAELLSLDWFLGLWRTSISERRSVTIAVHGSGVIGFAAAGPAGEAGVDVRFQLNAINVRQAYWGTGVGQRLLDAAIEDRDAFLWVFRDNARARAFYVRNGFLPDGAERVEPLFGPIEIRMVRRRAG